MTENPNRVAPPEVYQIAPGLGLCTDSVLFGEVWKRPSFSLQDRSLDTVSTLIASGKSPQLGAHTRRALDNGVTPAEIGELITHLAFYCGWPAAMLAVQETMKVFEERGINTQGI